MDGDHYRNVLAFTEQDINQDKPHRTVINHVTHLNTVGLLYSMMYYPSYNILILIYFAIILLLQKQPFGLSKGDN